MQAQYATEKTSMRSYEMSTPRLALGTAAVALTAIAMAVMVIIPATMDAEASEAVVPPAAAVVLASGADGTHQGHMDGTCAAESRDGDQRYAHR
jgi:peptidoglycan/LPS O-acetylase OafA/YrhL